MRSKPSAAVRFLFLMLAALFAWQAATAQKTRAQLEREKRQNLARIAETNRILQETGAEKQASLGQLSALSEQITTRQGLINKISEEVQLLDREIEENGRKLTAMESDFMNLQREYAAMLYAASKTTSSYNKLLFLFSSSNVTDMLMRMKYLKQYSESRKEQFAQIETARLALTSRRATLDAQKSDKRSLLSAQLRENKSLVNLKDKQSRVVQQLGEREKELTAELAERRESVERLERLIAAVIAEEVRRAAERERLARERERAAAAREAAAARRRPGSRPAARPLPEAPVAAAAASSFEGARAQLSWPVGSGFIASHFGRQSHPVLKGVLVENHGVDIQTNRGEEVRAVYDGEVATITDIPGMHKLVMLRHGGDYFTVYAKLARVSVERGQKVKARQVLGEVYTDGDGTSQVQFQIWRNQEKLNPESWLRDK